jgi:hypothetical protein
MVKNLYAIWIRIDETLPWIELKETYQTRKEANKAAEDFLKGLRMEIVEMPMKGNQMKALATVKR